MPPPNEKIELKPCPFCGTRFTTVECGASNPPVYRVSCNRCPCSLFEWHPSKEKAIAAWNQRAKAEEVEKGSFILMYEKAKIEINSLKMQIDSLHDSLNEEGEKVHRLEEQLEKVRNVYEKASQYNQTIGYDCWMTLFEEALSNPESPLKPKDDDMTTQTPCGHSSKSSSPIADKEEVEEEEDSVAVKQCDDFLKSYHQIQKEKLTSLQSENKRMREALRYIQDCSNESSIRLKAKAAIEGSNHE